MPQLKLMSSPSIPVWDFNHDADVIAFGTTVLKSPRDPDLPIPGIQKFMEFNLAPFEKRFKNSPKVLALCNEITEAIKSSQISFRIMTDLFLRLVTAAEQDVSVKDGHAVVELVEFTTELPHEKELNLICENYKKGLVQLPLYRDKGIFSLDLLLKTMLDTVLDTTKIDAEKVKTFWPYAICTDLTTVDGFPAGPATVGRHDREHLALFAARIKGLNDPAFTQFNTWDVVEFNIIAPAYKRANDELLAKGKDHLIPYLLAFTTYYLHEKLGVFAALLSTQKGILPDFLHRNDNEKYKDAAQGTGLDPNNPEVIENLKLALDELKLAVVYMATTHP